MIVNKFELLSEYEYICILMQPMHCTGISNFAMHFQCVLLNFMCPVVGI